MNFRLFLEGYDISELLSAVGKAPTIGSEKIVYDKDNGICKYISSNGSYRYVYKIDGKIISAVQVMSKDKKDAKLGRIYTLPEFRRHGYCRKLFQQAKKDFHTILDADEYSDLGKLWRNNVL